MSSESAMEKVNKDAAEVNTSAAAAEVSSAPSTTPTQGAEGIKPHNRCDELKQQIAAAISIVDKFRLSNRNEEAAATDKDAVPAPDTDSSKRPTIPVSGGQETASSSGSAGSEASYSEETSCEIEESSIATHHLVANDYISPFGEIPFEHLANPEKYNNQYIEVKKSALGGMGVFAKTDLKKGQLILAERPTFSADPESLYEELEKIAPELLAAFKRMHGHKRYPDQEDRAAIFHLVRTFRPKATVHHVGFSLRLWRLQAALRQRCRANRWGFRRRGDLVASIRGGFHCWKIKRSFTSPGTCKNHLVTSHRPTFTGLASIDYFYPSFALK